MSVKHTYREHTNWRSLSAAFVGGALAHWTIGVLEHALASLPLVGRFFGGGGG